MNHHQRTSVLAAALTILALTVTGAIGLRCYECYYTNDGNFGHSECVSNAAAVNPVQSCSTSENSCGVFNGSVLVCKYDGNRRPVGYLIYI